MDFDEHFREMQRAIDKAERALLALREDAAQVEASLKRMAEAMSLNVDVQAIRDEMEKSSWQ